MTDRLCLFSALAFAAAGCWTFNETPYPEVETAEAPLGTNVTVAVTGFASTLTDYAMVHEFHTVYVPGYVGRRHYRPGYYETVPTVSYIPQARPTDMFQRRAKDEFEKAGFSVGAAVPDWTVDVEFSGPVVTNGDTMKQLGWMLCTVFFCDYEASAWTAKLRVRDNRTGKLVFHHDYAQRYETNVFGLLPLFGISACRNTSSAFMQTWCLSALTDRAVADAAAYLAGRR